jgi:hypothetical protein
MNLKAWILNLGPCDFEVQDFESWHCHCEFAHSIVAEFHLSLGQWATQI